MGGLPVDSDFRATIVIDMNASVQEREFPLLFRFRSELNVRIDTVDVRGEVINVVFVNENEGIVDISEPYGRGCGTVARALVSKVSIYKFATIGEPGEPIAAPWVCL